MISVTNSSCSRLWLQRLWLHTFAWHLTHATPPPHLRLLPYCTRLGTSVITKRQLTGLLGLCMHSTYAAATSTRRRSVARSSSFCVSVLSVSDRPLHEAAAPGGLLSSCNSNGLRRLSAAGARNEVNLYCLGTLYTKAGCLCAGEAASPFPPMGHDPVWAPVARDAAVLARCRRIGATSWACPSGSAARAYHPYLQHSKPRQGSGCRGHSRGRLIGRQGPG